MNMKMLDNNKLQKIGLLTVGFGLLIIIVLLVVFLQPKRTKPTLTAKPTPTIKKKPSPTATPSAVVSKVYLYLRPKTLSVKLEQSFSLYLALNDLKSKLRTADVVLIYDSPFIEFIKVESTHPNYKNVRALTKNNQLILSFIKNETTTNKIEENITLANLQFKAIKKGSAKIYPLHNNTAKSSAVFLTESLNNKIDRVDGTEIAIK